MKRCVKELEWKNSWPVEWINECCDGLGTESESVSSAWLADVDGGSAWLAGVDGGSAWLAGVDGGQRVLMATARG